MGIRVGIIGTGFGGRVHAPILQKHPDFELVALCSVRPGKAQTEALRLQVPAAYDDWRRMISEAPLDLVVIASQPILHAEMTVHALNRGLHVLCEKPPALNLSEARTMQDTAVKSNGRLLINFEWRYLPERQIIKRILNEGRLGEIIHVNWSEAWGILGTIRDDESSWHWQTEKGGGMLGAVGSHMIDALHHWFGPISNVQGLTVRQVHERRGMNGVEPNTAEDSFVLQGKFESGGTCSLQFIVTSVGAAPKIEIFGDKGTMVLEGKDLKIATESERDFGPIEVPPCMDTSDFSRDIQPYVHAQWALYSELAREIRGEHQPLLPTFEDALMVQRVMDSLRRNGS